MFFWVGRVSTVACALSWAWECSRTRALSLKRLHHSSWVGSIGTKKAYRKRDVRPSPNSQSSQLAILNLLQSSINMYIPHPFTLAKHVLYTCHRSPPAPLPSFAACKRPSATIAGILDKTFPTSPFITWPPFPFAVLYIIIIKRTILTAGGAGGDRWLER